MKFHEFDITLGGWGETPEEAWEDAVEAFCSDPGDWHEVRAIEDIKE